MIFSSLVSLIYPYRCIGCDAWAEEKSGVCPSCHQSIQFLNTPAHFPHLNKQFFETAHSLAAYEAKMVDWLHHFKYHCRLDVGKALINMLLQKEFDWNRYDVMTFVPMHWRHEWMRHFNPAWFIASQLSQKTVRPFLSLLKKNYATPRQTKLSQNERLENVKGSFALRRKQEIHGKQILLIDDVVTTGATVNECARILMEAKAKLVDILTLARPLY